MSIISAAPDLRHDSLAARFRRVRTATETLCLPLSPEDHVVQSMPDASPAKWHLAHTSWFFETFLLKPYAEDYRELDPAFAVLFNSYYETVGAFHPRSRRGMLVRPDIETVYRYRDRVTQALLALLETRADDPEIAARVELGCQHEQQHQELLLTDVKHLYAENPIVPVYRVAPPESARAAPEMTWHEFPGGIVDIGAGPETFSFDNERPRHRALLEPFALGSRLVTNGEYLRFVQTGGYSEPQHWLSDGWAAVQRHGWIAPLYWQNRRGTWHQRTLSGEKELVESEPVCHLSYYEADAYARWAGARLPTEFEWEHASAAQALQGCFVDSGRLHPLVAKANGDLQQLFGDVWEWTMSPYAPYPGFRPNAGALGEYNAKFMCNQFVLRGGSCVTPADHVRRSYRNFFPPEARWQFSGLRLARYC